MVREAPLTQLKTKSCSILPLKVEILIWQSESNVMSTICFWDAILIREVIPLGFTFRSITWSKLDKYSLISVILERKRTYTLKEWNLMCLRTVNGNREIAMMLSGLKEYVDMDSIEKLSSCSLNITSEKKISQFILLIPFHTPILNFKTSLDKSAKLRGLSSLENFVKL